MSFNLSIYETFLSYMLNACCAFQLIAVIAVVLFYKENLVYQHLAPIKQSTQTHLPPLKATGPTTSSRPSNIRRRKK